MIRDDLPLDAARSRLAELTRAQKIASLLMLHVRGTDPAIVRAFTEEHRPGGLIFMPDNIAPTIDGVAKLAAAARGDRLFPGLIAIDQEGGLVRRITNDEFESSVTLKHRPHAETYDAFVRRSRMLAKAGITVNFGIVADVTSDRNSFMYGRALGETHADAAERVRAAVLGEAGSVLSTLKHFPGHGRTPGDSHTSIPETTLDFESWLTTDAVPFEAGIAAGADLVMVGHLKYSAIDSSPATLSARWHTILRERLGFDGVILTDDMFMLSHSGIPEYQDPLENAIRALAAGNTMLLYVLGADSAADATDAPTLVAGISAAVDAGRLSDAQIDDAALRLLLVRHRASDIGVT